MKQQKMPARKYVSKKSLEHYTERLQNFTKDLNDQLTMNLEEVNGVECYDVLQVTIKEYADRLKGLSMALRNDLKPINADRL